MAGSGGPLACISPESAYRRFVSDDGSCTVPNIHPEISYQLQIGAARKVKQILWGRHPFNGWDYAA